MQEADRSIHLSTLLLNITEEQLQRFWSRVNKDGPTPDQSNPYYAGLGPCWEWTHRLNNMGYGIFEINGRKFLAHRTTYTFLVGKIPEGHCALHKCDNPKCANPDHLRIGTQKENVGDMMRKGRQNNNPGLAWVKSHPECWARGEGKGAAKLTEDKVRSIRAMHSSGGVFLKELAAMFGVSQCVIWHVVHRRAWRHVA